MEPSACGQLTADAVGIEPLIEDDELEETDDELEETEDDRLDEIEEDELEETEDDLDEDTEDDIDEETDDDELEDIEDEELEETEDDELEDIEDDELDRELDTNDPGAGVMVDMKTVGEVLVVVAAMVAAAILMAPTEFELEPGMKEADVTYLR